MEEGGGVRGVDTAFLLPLREKDEDEGECRVAHGSYFSDSG